MTSTQGMPEGLKRMYETRMKPGQGRLDARLCTSRGVQLVWNGVVWRVTDVTASKAVMKPVGLVESMEAIEEGMDDDAGRDAGC